MKILLKRSNLLILVIAVLVISMLVGTGLAYATVVELEGEGEGGAATVEAISLTPEGEYGNAGSGNSDISADGRYVVYQSNASDLVEDDTNESSDILITDRLTGETELVSESEEGTLGNDSSTQPSISADGLYVAFQSAASNLVEGDLNEAIDIFVRDLVNGLVTLMSVNSDGTQGNSDSTRASVTSDGERVFVAYQSIAANLVDEDTNGGTKDVFVSYYWLNDPARQVYTELVSRRSDGIQRNNPSGDPSITGDGMLVAYESKGKLDRDYDTDSNSDIYVTAWEVDTESGFDTTLVSDMGDAFNVTDCLNPFISADGSTISFDVVLQSEMGSYTQIELVTNWQDRNPEDVEYEPVSGNFLWMWWGNDTSEHSSLSADGRYVAFESDADDLVVGDNNNKRDIFIRDLWEGITYLVSSDVFGEQANARCGNDDGTIGPAITPSYDGVIPQVSFFSRATNLTYAVDGIMDYNEVRDVFVATLDPRPTITSIVPAQGTTAGGTVVYIYGTNLIGIIDQILEAFSTLRMSQGLLGVTFDGIDALDIIRVSTMKLIAISPAHAAGKVQVQVTTVAGSTADTTADDYTYVAPASVVKTRGYARHQQDDKLVVYTGDWKDSDNDELSKKSGKYTSDKTATITITFKGTQFDWIATLGPTMGKALVSVDGGEAVLVDLYSATELFQQVVWSTGTLAYGEHTVTITFPEGTDYVEGKSINIDAFDVYGALPKLEAVDS